MFVEGLLHTHWYRWLVRVSGCLVCRLVSKRFVILFGAGKFIFNALLHDGSLLIYFGV
jgi:hypothetical protein